MAVCLLTAPTTRRSPPPHGDGLLSLFQVFRCSAGEDVDVGAFLRAFGSVEGDTEAGCCGLTGIDELVGATEAVVVDVGAGFDERLALGEGQALLTAASHAVDLSGDRRRIIGARNFGGERHDDDRVVGLSTVGVHAAHVTFRVEAVGEVGDRLEVDRRGP